MLNREAMLSEKMAICTAVMEDEYNGAPVPPIYQNSLFLSKPSNIGGYGYSRASNPTVEYTEKVIAKLEHAERALCFSSGMGAISASVLSCLSAGDHVVAMRNIYGPTVMVIDDILSRFGVRMTRIDKFGVEDFEAAITPETKLIYLESPSYLFFEIVDLRAVTALAKSRGIITIIDNSWSSPIFQNPIDMGVDIVVHTASKYLGGHSDIVAGVACGSKELMDKVQNESRSLIGACIGPHDGWLMMRGIRTLALRVLQHETSALKTAAFLENHENVAKAFYPGLPSHEGYELAKTQMGGYTGLLSFLIYKKPDDNFITKLKTVHTAPSWGGFESLAVDFGNPRELPADANGRTPAMIRLFVGLEPADIIIEDLDQALKQI